MRWSHLSILLLICAVAVLLAGGLAAAPWQGTPAVVAVLDGEQVLDSMKQRIKLEEQIVAEFKARNAELSAAEQELQAMVAEMEMLKKGSPEYNTKARQRTMKQAELEFMRQEIVGDLERKRMESFSRLLGDIERAAQSYAEANDIDLVFQKRLRLEASGPAWNSVLYAREPLDITEEVVKVVNQQ